MTGAPHPTCPYLDAVLAHFLEGDASGLAPHASPSELAGHLDSCTSCRELLASARRLDALIASGSPTALDEPAAERIFAGVRARVQTQPNGPNTESAVRPSRGRRAAAQAALVACGFAAAVVVFQLLDEPGVTTTDRARDDSTPGARAQPEQPPAAASSPLERWLRSSGAIVIEDDVAAAPVRQPRGHPQPRSWRTPVATATRLTALATDRASSRGLWPSVMLRAMAWNTPLSGGLPAVAGVVADEVRVDAACRLAMRPSAAATAGLIRFLATEPRGPVLRAVLARLRPNRAVAERLRRALGSTPRAGGLLDADALCRAGAVLGDPRLDAALRRAVDGDVAIAEALASAAGRAAVRPDRVPFLLGLWSDLQNRGLEARDGSAPAADESPAEARARRWFGALPAEDTAALVRQARQTRQAGQRHRCLLALAARGDAHATEYLLSVVHGRRFEESLLAAHALGRCRSAAVALRLRDELPRSRRPEMLLAALASAGHDGIAADVAALELTPEEKGFLRAGAFRLSQFGIAASLFRRQRAETF